jgi:hypothetical protein
MQTMATAPEDDGLALEMSSPVTIAWTIALQRAD